MKIRRIAVTIVFSLLVFSGMYIHATMNAIGESYQQGLDGFKTPFYIINKIVIGSSCLWLVAVFFSKRLRVISQAYLVSFGVGIMLTSTLILILGFSPCFKPHPTSETRITHHTLNAVVTRSLLCPRYSNRSYPGIIIFSSLGLAMVFIGRRGDESS